MFALLEDLQMQLSEENNSDTAIREKVLELCRAAMKVGQEIDLSGCGYGTPHWDSTKTFINDPFLYYYFLAGFVRATGSSRVMELGTHCGGSIRSMIRGIPDHIPASEANFVTMDRSFTNQEAFVSPPDSYIKRIHSDSNDPRALELSVSYFANQQVDILYIDTDHTYEDTLPQIYQYGKALTPTWLILDDIHLNPSMDRLWDYLVSHFGTRCVDVSEVAIRTDAGFGVVLLGNA